MRDSFVSCLGREFSYQMRFVLNQQRHQDSGKGSNHIFYERRIVEMREKELVIIIEQEKLKPIETRQFMENAFREGEVKTVGTDIDKILPPVSRFGGGNRAAKKKAVIDRLKAYFEKFYGLGVVEFKADKEAVNNVVTYDFKQIPVSMVAESSVEYGSKKD